MTSAISGDALKLCIMPPTSSACSSIKISTQSWVASRLWMTIGNLTRLAKAICFLNTSFWTSAGDLSQW